MLHFTKMIAKITNNSFKSQLRFIEVSSEENRVIFFRCLINKINDIAQYTIICSHNVRNIKIRINTAWFTDAHCFISKLNVQTIFISSRINSYLLIPISLQVRMIRNAISPRLAINILLNIILNLKMTQFENDPIWKYFKLKKEPVQNN